MNSKGRIHEAGRSMVEILGTLSIMGILSLVGLKMYHSAVNSHRANELIYEANKRATMVAAQIMAGNTTLSIAEFTNPAGHTFGVEKNPQNVNQFNITIYPVDVNVCTQMKNMVGPGTTVRKINSTCTALTFNNDLSGTIQASDYATKTTCEAASNTWCAGMGLCRSEQTCCEGISLTECQGCTETGAVLESAKEGQTCNYHGVVGICHNGICEAKSTEANCVAGGVRCNDPNYGTCCPVGYMCTTGGDTPGVCKKFSSGCTTNADCTDPAKPWCKLSITGSGCNAVPSGGTCTAVESGTPKTVRGLGTVITKVSIDWWNAKNWCEAKGMRLANIEDFDVYRSGTTQKVTANSNDSFTCARGQTCADWSGVPYKAMWNGTYTLVETAGDADGLYMNRFSPIVIELRKTYGNAVFWTASDHNNNACRAFYVYLAQAYARNVTNRATTYSALCL